MAERPVIHAHVRGAEQLNAAIRALPAALQERTVIDGLRLALNPVAQDARQRAPSKGIRRGIRIDRPRRRIGGRFYRLGFSLRLRAAHPLSHVFEFGTEPRKTRAGWRRGRIRPHLFMTGAWHLHRAVVEGDLSGYLLRALARKANRLRLKVLAKGAA